MKLAIDIPKQLLDFKCMWRMVDVNRYLGLTCILITLFFVFDFVKTNIELSERLTNVEKTAPAATRNDAVQAFPPVTIDQISQEAKKRKIFLLNLVKTQDIVDSSIKQLFDNLKLVAVFWSDQPQAVVEDSKQGKNFVLNVGDLVGPFKLKSISMDSAILEQDGREWELK